MTNHPFISGSLVAAYFRDSGGDTQELSVPQQESAFRAWCTQNGLIPGAVFRDIARPGSSVIGRSGFHDMIYHFRSGQAQEAGLVIWSYSRFAREFDDSQFYRADLRRRGFIFYSLNDEIPEGSIGRLFEAAIDWKNEQFLIDLSRDTRRGLHDLVKNYGAVPGTPPRGFKREPVSIGKRRDGRDRIAHRWVPDPEVIPKVRQAFAMRAAGKTLAEIHAVTHLYGSYNSFNTFFTNKIYIGILEFGDQVIEHYCDPLIDQTTWQTVQLLIKQFAAHRNLDNSNENDPGNPHHPRRVNSSYLLSGLVYCARCGSPLFGAPSKQRYKPDGTRNADYRRYACTRSYRRHDCDQGQFPQKVLDTAVLATLKEYILLPEVLMGQQIQVREDRDEYLSGLKERRSSLQSILRGVRRRIANLTEAIAESGHTRSLLVKLSNLETEELTLRSQIADIESQMSASAPDWSTMQFDQWTSYAQNIIDSADIILQQRLLRAFVNKILVDRDANKIIGSITYHLPPSADSGPSTPEKDNDSVSMLGFTLGAPLHSHSFTVSFTAAMRPYNRKRP